MKELLTTFLLWFLFFRGKGHWFNWSSVVRNYNLMRRKKLHMFNKLILVFFEI